MDLGICLGVTSAGLTGSICRGTMGSSVAVTFGGGAYDVTWHLWCRSISVGYLGALAVENS